MKTRHTRGPWRFEWGFGRWHVQAEIPCINGLSAWVQVADAGGPEQSDEMFVEGIDYTANARLIASAPDLLAALQGVMADMASDFGTGFDYEECRTAIQKATGEAP